LAGWELNAKGEIQRQLKFKDFRGSMLFVGAVAHLAESMDHHPDILIQWNKVTLSVLTHSAGGLTDLDFRLASGIDALPALSR
jgi:4a-hydroxytetrahydrobiopterin dehydratase